MPTTKPSPRKRKMPRTSREWREYVADAVDQAVKEERTHAGNMQAHLRSELQKAKEEINRLGHAGAQEDQLRAELDAARLQPQIRVLRLVEYAGDRDAVQEAVGNAIHGTIHIAGRYNITAVTLHEYPEVLKIARGADSRTVDPSDAQDGQRAAGYNSPHLIRNKEQVARGMREPRS